MADIIAAKCFQCGKIVRVPSEFGGRQAKCPQCSGVITIPRPGDSTMNIVGDEMFEEVAVGDVKEAPATPAAPPEAPAPQKPVRPRGRPLRLSRGVPLRRRPSVVRKPGAASTPRGGTRGGRDARGGRAPARKSMAPVFIAVGAGVVILIIILAVALSSKGGPKPGEKEKKPPQEVEEVQTDPKLAERCENYIVYLNRAGNQMQIAGFYEQSEDRGVVRGVARLIEEGVKYVDHVIKSVRIQGDTGAVTFRCTYVSGETRTPDKEVTINWRKSSDGVWRISDKPAP